MPEDSQLRNTVRQVHSLGAKENRDSFYELRSSLVQSRGEGIGATAYKRYRHKIWFIIEIFIRREVISERKVAYAGRIYY
jgi:hypothetical protein